MRIRKPAPNVFISNLKKLSRLELCYSAVDDGLFGSLAIMKISGRQHVGTP